MHLAPLFLYSARNATKAPSFGVSSDTQGILNKQHFFNLDIMMLVSLVLCWGPCSCPCSPELSRAAAHHNVVANNFRTLLRTAQGMPGETLLLFCARAAQEKPYSPTRANITGLQESQAPSLKALLDVIDSPFVSALDDCYRKRTSQQGKDHGGCIIHS
eukprot:scaffold35925_cov21-Tisochrysis_lutea.AAC.1